MNKTVAQIFGKSFEVNTDDDWDEFIRCLNE